jgi:hypothetical protein
MAESTVIAEADILDQIVTSEEPGLRPEVARSILDLRFNSDGESRIKALLKKKNAGKITEGESAELDKYLRVGQFIDLLQAKARLSLRSGRSTNTAREVGSINSPRSL